MAGERSTIPDDPDLSRAKDRDAIRSAAAFVASSKVALDNAGKEANAALRVRLDAVDAERRRIRAFLDEKRDEVRAPLTAWEVAEAYRVAGLEARLAGLTVFTSIGKPAAEIAAEIERIEAVPIDETWQEFVADAARRKDSHLFALRLVHADAERVEAEQAELAQLRAEKEAREAEDRRVAAERAAAERQAAEEKAEAARQAQIARDREEAAAKAAAAARIAAEKAAAEKIMAAEAATKAAEEKAARAAAAEQARAAEERKREQEAQARRDASAKLRAEARRRIVVAVTGKSAEQIADALIAGLVPYTKVTL